MCSRLHQPRHLTTKCGAVAIAIAIVRQFAILYYVTSLRFADQKLNRCFVMQIFIHVISCVFKSVLFPEGNTNKHLGGRKCVDKIILATYKVTEAELMQCKVWRIKRIKGLFDKRARKEFIYE